MLNRKIYLVFGFLLLCWGNAFGQIGWTKQQILTKNNIENYKEGVADDTNDPFIYYLTNQVSSDGEGYTRLEQFVFDAETGRCYGRRIMEPLSEINSWVKHFNKNYVTMGELRWMDYENDWKIYVLITDNFVEVCVFVEEEE